MNRPFLSAGGNKSNLESHVMKTRKISQHECLSDCMGEGRSVNLGTCLILLNKQEISFYFLNNPKEYNI